MLKILIAEDQDYIRELIVSALRSRFECLQIIETSSGNEAVAKIVEHTDLNFVISDYSMPDGCGDIVCAQAQISGINVLLYTSTVHLIGVDPQIPVFDKHDLRKAIGHIAEKMTELKSAA